MTGRLLTGAVAEVAGWRWALAAAAALGLLCAVVVRVLLPRLAHFVPRGGRLALRPDRPPGSPSTDRGLLALFADRRLLDRRADRRVQHRRLPAGARARSTSAWPPPACSSASTRWGRSARRCPGRLADRYGRRAVLPARLRASPCSACSLTLPASLPLLVVGLALVDRRLLRHPRRRQRLGAGPGARGRPGHRPGRLALPVHLLRRRRRSSVPSAGTPGAAPAGRASCCSPRAWSSSSACSPWSCGGPRACCPTRPEPSVAVRLASRSACESRHVSVVIHRPPDEVYAFAAEPDHLARWAAGLAASDGAAARATPSS